MDRNIDTILIKKIEESGYRNLFLSNDDIVEKVIWNQGNNKDKLKSIAYSENTSHLARFLTVEILKKYNVEIDVEFYEIIAESYGYALHRTTMGDSKFYGIVGNLWGLLYEENDLGKLGDFYVSLGEKAIPSLVKLLSYDNSEIFYEGSEEATLGNSYQYRVKDFAAFYISKIKGIPMTFYQDFDKRDAEIERLKEVLENK
ncbi:hypothetical protein [uncultured Kordia sp.]|uniref:hypothetical protein n=1 Tax=uncultured Kordia sp. TaxID=507699 RepID=UPI002622D614|nr:hypothetical protein [uncultured Kordia sp.]